jgi:hypothetical protein
VAIRTAEPLPECRLCDQPTHRATWEANGELCTPCTRGIDETVRMLPVGLPPANDDTGYVERWTPPVPPRRPR